MEFAAQLKAAVLARNKDESLAIAKQALEANVDISKLMHEGLAPAVVEFGTGFAIKQNIPMLVLGTQIVQEVMVYLIRNVPGGKYTPKATMVIGCVPYDIYFPLRMQIVNAFFGAYGIRVVDLGSNVTPEKFLEAAEKENAQIIALSTYVVTAFYRSKAVFDLVKERGLRDKYVTLVGGTGIPSEDYKEKYGADVVEFDIMVAMEKTKQVLKDKLHIIL